MIRILPPDDLRLDLPSDEIAALCRKYDVETLAVFGSILRDDFGPSSDVDFLVRFRGNDCGPWMSKLTELEEDLSKTLNRPVDLVNWRGIEQSRNPIRRQAILDSARVVYEG
jgi:hypothetical protein